MPDPTQSVLLSWSVQPAATLALLLTALVYLRGRILLCRAGVPFVPPWRAASFLLGLLAVWIALASPLALPDLNARWREAIANAERLIEMLPAETIGSCFLDDRGQPATPDPTSAAFSALRPHRGTVGGAWPRISGA